MFDIVNHEQKTPGVDAPEARITYVFTETEVGE